MKKIKLFTDAELEMGEIFQSLLTTNISDERLRHAYIIYFNVSLSLFYSAVGDGFKMWDRLGGGGSRL